MMILKCIIKITFILIILVSNLYSPSEICIDARATYIEGIASWYDEHSPGIRKTTANMEIFNDESMTCAIWGVPFDTLLQVKNLDNGKVVNVRVNDRGPAKRLCRDGRVIDLTKAAFKRIASVDKGLIRVCVKIIS